MKTKTWTSIALSAGVVVAFATTSQQRHSDLSTVRFADECTTVSDPGNINLYAHEEIVNSFLSVKGKFGMSRVLRMPYNHEHFAKHGGTFSVPQNWHDDQYQYDLNEWGMLGALDSKATLYYLKQEFRTVAGISFQENDIAPLMDREADAFEVYAAKQLQNGEHLVRWERPDFIRYVGAIRAASSCLGCHADAKEGDVLGGFAYAFTKYPLPKDFIPDPVVTAAKAGQPMSALVQLTQAKQEWEVRQHLLAAGIVASEMIDVQRQTRQQVIDSAAQMARERKSASAFLTNVGITVASAGTRP